MLPVILNVAVPVLAGRLTETVRVELPGVVTGLGLKLALVRFGNPLTLRLTELEPLTVPRETVYLPLVPRFTVRDDGEAERVKSAGGAATVSVKLLEWVRLPLVPVTVIG